MHLKLHIGTEKTGTTTLQNWFATNRESLRSKGVFYPVSLGRVNHRHLSTLAMDITKPDDSFYQNKIFSEKEHQIFKSNLITDFNREYTENLQSKVWVISNEHLHSRLPNIEMIERVKKFLGEKFDDVEVLVHLRPQVDVAVSLASTLARNGQQINSKWFIKKAVLNPYFNYNLLIEKWETVFGADNITIVPFKKQPCMTSFLIDRLELYIDSLSVIERKNEAIDWRTMALVNAIPILRRNHSKNHNYKVFVEDIPYQEKLSIGLDFAKQLQSVFDESNKILINRRQELSLGDLTPNWNKYDIQENLHHLDNSSIFTEQLNYVVMRFNWEIKLEKCSTKLAECERALALKNITASSKFLEIVQATIQSIPNNSVTEARLEQINKRIEWLIKQVSQ